MVELGYIKAYAPYYPLLIMHHVRQPEANSVERVTPHTMTDIILNLHHT